jgi:hypothetical protein
LRWEKKSCGIQAENLKERFKVNTRDFESCVDTPPQRVGREVIRQRRGWRKEVRGQTLGNTSVPGGRGK